MQAPYKKSQFQRENRSIRGIVRSDFRQLSKGVFQDMGGSGLGLLRDAENKRW